MGFKTSKTTIPGIPAFFVLHISCLKNTGAQVAVAAKLAELQEELQSWLAIFGFQWGKNRCVHLLAAGC